MEQVNWDDVHHFINKLNSFHPALRTRLPWEAKWEYACRAGSETAFHFGDELSLEQANYRGTWDLEGAGRQGKTAKKFTAGVRSYPCNQWGLYEMHGNVWEWCADTWQAHLGTSAQVDPWRLQKKTAPGGRRVIRGGSWNDDGRDVRSACRYGLARQGVMV